jgi:hypothetical protein
MRVRHDRNPRSSQPALPLWSACLPSWAFAPSPLGRADRRQDVHNRSRLRSTGVTWTCARCGAAVQNGDMAAHHIATVHSGDPLPASSEPRAGVVRRLR